MEETFSGLLSPVLVILG